nr:arylsulfatase J-like [Lytechinus pictus]
MIIMKLIFCITLVIISNVCSTRISKPTKPNIVFILIDDLGYNDVGYHGSEIKTPNIDELARDGVRLENYYVQPICTPTRSQLLSGRYQIHTGLQHSYIRPAQPLCLSTNLPTFADKLREAGYATHAVGKWHLGHYKKDCLPRQRGFDSFFGYLTGSEDYWTHHRPGDGILPNSNHWLGMDLWDNERVAWEYVGNYSVFVFTDKIQQIVNQHSDDQPLLLYLPFQSVHSPLQVPSSYEERYKNIKNKNRRIYAGMMSCLDEAIGKVIQTLKQRELWENTVLIFSTDNGGEVAAGGNNWPLRGWKRSLWEGGMRGVGFVTSPLLPLSVQGTVNKELIHVSDWFPTLVQGLAGSSLDNVTLDGFNMWKTISSNASSPRKELLHNIDPWPNQPKEFSSNISAAIRVGHWKLLTGDPGANNGEWIPVPDSGITAISPIKIKGKDTWLFNITADPHEYHDLSTSHPEVVDELMDKLKKYYVDSVPVQYPDEVEEANPAFHDGLWGTPWQ